MRVIWFLFLFVCCLFPCFARGESIPLVFTDLENGDLYLKSLQGKEIEIRGFLYQREDGKLILASQPNLRSCCVGTKSKIQQQIIVEGNLEPTLKAVSVRGVFRIQPLYSENGELVAYYFLDRANLVPETPFRLWGIILVAFVVCIVSFLFKFLSKYAR